LAQPQRKLTLSRSADLGAWCGEGPVSARCAETLYWTFGVLVASKKHSNFIFVDQDRGKDVLPSQPEDFLGAAF